MQLTTNTEVRDEIGKSEIQSTKENGLLTMQRTTSSHHFSFAPTTESNHRHAKNRKFPRIFLASIEAVFKAVIIRKDKLSGSSLASV
jgi:hypothetical protein